MGCKLSLSKALSIAVLSPLSQPNTISAFALKSALPLSPIYRNTITGSAKHSQHTPSQRLRSTNLFVSSSIDDVQKSAALSDEEINPLFRFSKGEKEKVVNAFGVWTLFVSLVTCPIWFAAMKTVDAVCNALPDLDPHRDVYDYTGKIWSRVWLSMTMSFPEVTGDLEILDREKAKERGPCLYVANHASWLDIPILCTVLDPVFKFISKGELRDLPCIGDQLVGGKHMLIDREDRRSQLRTFKEGVAWLNDGVPIMAFPEGARSKDGRLMEFKGGSFAMALRTNLPIVPITIANAHAVMPSNALFPVQPGKGKLTLHIHSPIETEGMTDDELAVKVRDAIISKLPQDQLPVEKEEEVEGAAIA